ncbi:MAG TPA: IS1595 family transposase [Actinomycetota bacterium]|nr:IS1595 family transposase [Actinomycetota bacterium]
MEFDRQFPDDAACLDWLVGYLYPVGVHCPTCEKVTKHHRVKTRTCFACQFCGHQEYPMKGTIFEGSSTSLRLWFYGIYLMASTRGGISAKQLERELGVSYPTAWRMFNKIRSLMGQDADAPMEGTIEMDEAYIGGKPRLGDVRNRQDARMWAEKKAKVFGMVQRQGQIAAHVVPSTRSATVMEHVEARVLPGSLVYTDESPIYTRAVPAAGYEHRRVHHAAKVYVDGDVHTQTIEGFWALFKGGLTGVYHSVSEKYLQDYVDEYVFRYNHRRVNVFEAILSRIEKAPDAPPGPPA